MSQMLKSSKNKDWLMSRHQQWEGIEGGTRRWLEPQSLIKMKAHWSGNRVEDHGGHHDSRRRICILWGGLQGLSGESQVYGGQEVEGTLYAEVMTWKRKEHAFHSSLFRSHNLQWNPEVSRIWSRVWELILLTHWLIIEASPKQPFLNVH